MPFYKDEGSHCKYPDDMKSLKYFVFIICSRATTLAEKNAGCYSYGPLAVEGERASRLTKKII